VEGLQSGQPQAKMQDPRDPIHKIIKSKNGLRQVVEFLPSKHKVLSSNPRTIKNKNSVHQIVSRMSRMEETQTHRHIGTHTHHTHTHTHKHTHTHTHTG
jgi:hypothetical protein